ncbi:MAG: hypothetical protein GY703_10610 [Gammaproteobacteria bacterium]|nr:hypothetical protein [Gammaproteobacteria bacterium]
MNPLPPLRFAFPPNLSDEAAYEIFKFLEALSLAFDERYFTQIRRHYRAINPKRSDLLERPWEDDDEAQSFF